ncbi:MFS transporter [Streptomyces turgidiscabies]|uniref:MFS transporter n=1 Tax=Streptomyces turgidiscabies TaxID=85558 RepID=UPI0038F6E5A4
MPQPCCPAPHPRRLPPPSRGGAFALQTSVFVLPAASSAPTPLYAGYQPQWRFSALTLTTVFSTYALALLAAPLVVGTLSDHLGRRPVLAGVLLAEAVSMTVFTTAQGVTELIAAKVVEGLATSVAASAAGAPCSTSSTPGTVAGPRSPTAPPVPS